MKKIHSKTSQKKDDKIVVIQTVHTVELPLNSFLATVDDFRYTEGDEGAYNIPAPATTDELVELISSCVGKRYKDAFELLTEWELTWSDRSEEAEVAVELRDA